MSKELHIHIKIFRISQSSDKAMNSYEASSLNLWTSCVHQNFMIKHLFTS